jgi:rod shape-determining protein MreD
MTEALETLKIALLLFVAALWQVTVLGDAQIFGGTPDLLLVTLVAVAMLRGSLAGAGGGFFAGLIVDVAYLQTMGLTSLVLTVAGFWTGRYGETTGRDRVYAPMLSVAVVTVLATTGAFALRFILGESPDARLVFVEALLPTTILNVLVSPFVFALVRRVLPPRAAVVGAEVQLIG